MTPKKITDPQEAIQLIERFKKSSTQFNCFLMGAEIERLVGEGLLWCVTDGDNAFLLEDKGNCFRIHFIINNPDRGYSAVMEKPLMLELLFRSKDCEPEQMIMYWEKQGFQRNLVRNNMAAKYTDLELPSRRDDLDLHIASTKDEGEFARSLFNEVFDPYSGDYLNPEEITELLEDRKIIIAAKEGKPCGALHFYNIGKCAWIGHVAVTQEAQGHGIGSALVAEFIRLNHVDDKSRYALWVQTQNKAAVTMYDRFGFKETGKSSLSMIKEQ